MRRTKRAAALLLCMALCAALILSGCGQTEDAGLSLSASLGGELTSLDPVRAADTEDETVLNSLYENLMRKALNSDGTVDTVNALAKRYDTEKNFDGSVTYTFRLRSAKWSDGRDVTAEDFVYAWRRLADPATNSPHAELLSCVVGYDKVQSSGDPSQLAVSAKNDSTLEVTVTGECPWFLTDVCTAVATVPLREDVVKRLKEAAQTANKSAAAGAERATWCSDPTKLVTNGVYAVEEYQPGSYLLLKANSRYSGTFSGPESVKLLFADTAEDRWALYEEKTADFVAPLPEDQLKKLAEDKTWSPQTELNTEILAFNTGSDLFSDPMVRKAFSLAIDRTALSAAVSPAVQPAVGLIPYGVPETEDKDFRSVGGDLVNCNQEEYDTDRQSALSLLSDGGYDSLTFPETELLYAAEDGEQPLATALAAMLSDALNIRVTARGVTAEEKQAALESGDYQMAVTNLTAEANDAVSFLSAWKSGSSANVAAYRNSAYDTLLAVIASASDEKARLGCLHDAESLLLTDCPLTPLYFGGTEWKLRDGLTGVCRDPRGWFSFASVTQVSG